MNGCAPSLRVFVAVVAALVLGLAREARAEDAERAVYLYTMGPSNELPSRFGHSLLCVREAGHDTPEHGRCYDYGVPGREDLTATVWEAVRETPSFVPVAIEEVVVYKFFKDQGRQIERQRLPMTAAQVDKLVSSIEAEIRDKRAYAYHPYWANCATKIRDHIDDATDGRLRPGPSDIPKGTFREYMEEGHSGHLDFLTAMALFVGEGNDRSPTPWEAMMLPFILRDGVAERFSVPPEKLEERLAVVLPTSRAIGRFAVFALAFLLFVAVRVAARRNKLRVGLVIAGGVLGAIAIAIALTSALVKWPEISHNWALVLVLPTDLALPWLKGKRLALYLKARLGMAGVFVVLEIANVVHQPMLPLAALVALPMAGILSALKERERAADPAAAPAAASASSGPRAA
ncbi:MAG: DUF4105 domain-containing protein [Labilithrix sp.]|nr:DUF4105 domain-containing protein [Labilithrix sp.]MCW5836674.1 DUF4105 domain-containing protein [Labilithrix sp.]